MTHDYKRNGTTTLFAALNVLDGTVIGRNMQRHRHQEFIRFLNTVEAQVPAGKVIHAIVDNYATHKHPKVRIWLAHHPRWIFHFTPTSASWLNAVEGFFAKLTRRRLRRGVFHSVVDLQAAINRFIESSTPTQHPSSGLPIQPASSQPSNEGNKRWSQSTSQAMNGWRTRCPPTGSSWQFVQRPPDSIRLRGISEPCGPKIFEAWDRFAQIAASGKAGPQRGLICAWDWYEHRILLEP